MSRFDFSKPAGPDPSKAEATRRIKQWVAGLQVLGADGVVHVAEMQCHEPGCPDFETVITLMYSRPSEDRSVKILKPLADVTQDEVIQSMLKSFADGPPAVAALKAEMTRQSRRHARETTEPETERRRAPL